MGRILNRHRRGKPKYDMMKRLRVRLLRVLPVLIIAGIIGAGLIFIAFWGVP